MIKCKICEKDFKSIMSLARHITQAHKVSVNEYYDTYLKKNSDGMCSKCGKPTRFINLNIGYSNTCSHSCGASVFRKELKADKSKYEKFISEVSKNQVSIWNNRSENEKNLIFAKISDSTFDRKSFCNFRKSNVDLQTELETIGIHDCKKLGLQPIKGMAWEQSQSIVSKNLANLFGIE